MKLRKILKVLLAGVIGFILFTACAAWATYVVHWIQLRMVLNFF